MKNLVPSFMDDKLEKYIRLIIKQELKNSSIEINLVIENIIRDEIRQYAKNILQNNAMSEVTNNRKIQIMTNSIVNEIGKTHKICGEANYKWITEAEFSKRKENINEYVIWMNYDNGEVFIFGKPFASSAKKKPCKNKMGFRKLIVLLLKEQKYHHYAEIFNVYTDDEYYNKLKQRKRINKVLSKLKIYSKGSLEAYIRYDEGRGLGLYLEGLPFCVFYGVL